MPFDTFFLFPLLVCTDRELKRVELRFGDGGERKYAGAMGHLYSLIVTLWSCPLDSNEQKRWNVYNRDNRAKVARDELAAKLDEEEERERQLQAAQAERLEVLRKRRLGATGTAPKTN